MNQEEISRIVCAEEIKLSIVRNEVISVTDASVKDGNMAGLWKF